MSINAFYELYEANKRPFVKESTWDTKSSVIETWVLPYLGDVKLADVSALDILRWQNEIQGHRDSAGIPLSQTYMRTIVSQLSAMFNHAVRYYGLRANPMRDAEQMGKKKPDREVRTWTREQYLQFRELVMDKPESFLAFEILYWTGIREGELLALTPDDFDAARSSMRVNKTYQRRKLQDVTTSPKTPKSNMAIVIPPFLMEEVKDHIRFDKIPKRERIFHVTKYFLHHEMDRGCAAAGLERIRIHDLCHSHVSPLIGLGYTVPTIAERMGHEGINITLQYTHLFPDKQVDMAADLQRLNSLKGE